jgi:hypothetical protein
MLGAGRMTADSPRRHWCSIFKPDGEAWVRFVYRRVMTYVVLDDDLDWEFAFDSHLGHPNRNDWKYRRIGAASNEAGVLSNESVGGVVPRPSHSSVT